MGKPKCWVKNVIKKIQLKVKVEVGLNWGGLSIFDPNLGWNNPAFFRVVRVKALMQVNI